MKHVIEFEQPGNEFIRTCLRIEQLLSVINSIPYPKLALQAIVETIAILDRTDIKSLFHKYLSKHVLRLQKLVDNPNIDASRLEGVLSQLDGLCTETINQSGKFAQPLRNNDFLHSIRMYLGNPAGLCDFDIPALAYWCTLPQAIQQEQIVSWFEALKPIPEMVALILQLTRFSHQPMQIQAEKGFYQNALDSKSTCDLVRIQLDKNLAVFPEISVGKHRMSVRFLHFNPNDHDQQYEETVDCLVTICAF